MVQELAGPNLQFRSHFHNQPLVIWRKGVLPGKYDGTLLKEEYKIKSENYENEN